MVCWCCRGVGVLGWADSADDGESRVRLWAVGWMMDMYFVAVVYREVAELGGR